MDTRGTFAPTSAAEARARFEALGPVAQTVVREVARAMAFDREEYGERVTSAVVERARNALFASELEVTVGTREEFEAWVEERDLVAGGPDEDDVDVVVFGNENVDNVAWHAPGFAEAVATTFQNEPDAAVETLRRQAFGRVYREVVEGTEDG